MRVAVRDPLDRRIGISSARQEALGDPRRDAQVAQDHGHRGRVVLAEPLLVRGETLDVGQAFAGQVADIRRVLVRVGLEHIDGGGGEIEWVR